VPLSNQSTHQTNIKPIDWPLELDEDIIERGHQFLTTPIYWQVELEQGIAEFLREC
jgi:hypothetical protein